MAFDDFIAKWANKPVDFDGVYPNQCMDLMHQYVYDVLHITDASVLAHPAAYQVFTDFTETQYFDKIANTPSGVPQKGDIVLFNKTSSNPYGHVCVFIEGDSNKFKSFDANYPLNSLPHVQDHTYGYCLGWLHPKTSTATPTMTLDGKVFENLVRKSTITDRIREKLGVEDSETVMVAEIEKLIKYEDAVVQKDKQLGDATTQVTTLQNELRDLTAAHEETTKKNLQLQKDVETLQGKLATQGAQMHDLSAKLDTLKEQTHLPILAGWKKFLYQLLVRT